MNINGKNRRGRSRFRTALVLAVILLAGLYGYGRFIEPYRLSVTEEEITIEGYFRSPGTVRIVFLADLHIIDAGRRERRLLETVEELAPDLILIAGDFIKTGADPGETIAAAARLRAPLGVYGVVGNIDISHRQSRRLLQGLEAAGVDMLRDRRRRLRAGDLEFDLVGFDLNPSQEEVAEVFAGRESGFPQIVLTHWPYLLDILTPHQPELILCGHTHGGQVRLPVFGSFFARLLAGTHYDQGLFTVLGSRVYVTRGVGMTTHQIRLFCPPEIVFLTVNFVNREFQ
ncbi:MAG: metallophosphoesterase family protein [Candidatus Erginobacter occultus]|nr:metallophosphoesterase family protein [Candidatus Erginobacter occultus]